jgi:hypothetical protein
MKQEMDAEDEKEIEKQAKLQARLSEIRIAEQAKIAQAQAAAQQQMAGAGATPGVPGNVTVLPEGQPQVMTVGELPGGSQQFPLPTTNLKPFGQALNSLTQQGAGGQPAMGGAPGGTPSEAPQSAGPGGEQPSGAQSEREPMMVRAADVVKAVKEIPARIASGQIRSRSGGFRGDVYLMGDLATKGMTMGNIELGCTVDGDAQLIQNALPQWRGRLSIRPLRKGEAPTVGKLIVKGGEGVSEESPTGGPKPAVAGGPASVGAGA